MSSRIAIVNADKCRPKKCGKDCKKICPVNRMGKLCIEIEDSDKLVTISESLCNGCGLCIKKCPFNAIKIINLPKELTNETTHRFGKNTFKLFRLPQPRIGQVLGLVGINGIGKTTALNILSGKIKPNLGQYSDPPQWNDIINYFRGSDLQNYLLKIVNTSLTVSFKPQFVNILSEKMSGTVKNILNVNDKHNILHTIVDDLYLSPIMTRNIKSLSGGELQRFAIALTLLKKSDVYIFDEPSSYLDIKQRLHAAKIIRQVSCDSSYTVVVEHDLAVLDYLSDYVCCLYGEPSAYGVITTPYSVREGINIFLEGYIPTENIRFREFPLIFNLNEISTDEIEHIHTYLYPSMSKTFNDFKIDIEEGSFTDSEIIVLLGENGTGKTTFIRLLSGILKPDNDIVIPEMNISYKPQKIKPLSENTVIQLLYEKIGASIVNDPQFKSDVIKPLNLESIYDNVVTTLSGGEIQKLAIVMTLGKSADIYLLDEPSAYLDSEQRIIVSKVIKRFIVHNKKTAFIVEHDFMMATYLADKVIVFNGIPSIQATAKTPQSLTEGVNDFLQSLEITFRRDPINKRPRINKCNSVRDTEQKLTGKYFYVDN
jgi:ATP-binding cassette, sub-family E, member 1